VTAKGRIIQLGAPDVAQVDSVVLLQLPDAEKAADYKKRDRGPRVDRTLEYLAEDSTAHPQFHQLTLKSRLLHRILCEV
jgi:hypothetical protein